MTFRVLGTISALFTLLVLLNACSSDPCEGVVCHNGGVATESGNDCFCDCPAGFTGSNCETEVCSLIDCNGNGEKALSTDGQSCSCDCNIGYEGVFCNNEMRAKFAGTYTGIENCGSQGSFNNSYTVSWDASINANEFYLKNLFVPGTSVKAVLTSSTAFDIPAQMSQNYSFTGSGSLQQNNSLLVVDFTITSGTVTAQCSASMSK